jgi:hypothetical protein
MLAVEVDVEEPREDKARFQRKALIRICEWLGVEQHERLREGLMFSRVDTRRSV